MTVATFPNVIVRALVVEQLNADQWHVVVQGAEVPYGSLESRGTGVASFAAAAGDAVELAELTGLPVLIAGYNEAVRPLNAFPSDKAFWRQRYRRRSSLDHILYGSIGGEA